MNTRGWVLLTACLLSAARVHAGGATAPLDPAVIGKLHGDLARVLDEAAPDELIPIKAIMRDQVSRADIDAARAANPDRDTRRAVITGMLKSLAQRSQPDLLDDLHARQRAGTAGPRIRTLWLTNVVAADVTRGCSAPLSLR